MNFGNAPREAIGRKVTAWTAAALALLPATALAQDVPADAAAPFDAPAADAAAATATADAATGYTPLGADMIKGQPVDGALDLQPQFSDVGEYAFGFHVALVWIMAAISVFVLGLLLYVMFRYRKAANPTPSKTTHNTMVEVVWTVVPVLILVGIAIPSISLLSKQYETPPEDAVTVKITGYQWNWGYEFPDQGIPEFIANMMPVEDAKAAGLPALLEVDNRVVLPVNTPIRIQTTAADVIHSWAVPALWFKMDAVPGRLNEKLLTIKEPGIYYGQCSELCGVKHAYMPIAVEAVPLEQWQAWVRSKGGSIGGEEEAAAPAAAAATDAAPATTTTTAAAAAPAAAAPAVGQ
ncbi:cytochrome c oxidase subunit II [Altererythrobacter sp. H2]|uniref:cytochrome c oxidase subunit II n=1 Tax=Altererythrobacter sp. H2 TaxID=3108391 RepID=UPI002B4C191D|nr:cytochrome c oxidase subunit II [Altererythrobacter sp. H2]WRK97161.1 cytochrome c oxidase subunit II [Altererythrobacter sp. H2]